MRYTISQGLDLNSIYLTQPGSLKECQKGKLLDGDYLNYVRGNKCFY